MCISRIILLGILPLFISRRHINQKNMDPHFSEGSCKQNWFGSSLTVEGILPIAYLLATLVLILLITLIAVAIKAYRVVSGLAKPSNDACQSKPTEETCQPDTIGLQRLQISDNSQGTNKMGSMFSSDKRIDPDDRTADTQATLTPHNVQTAPTALSWSPSTALNNPFRPSYHMSPPRPDFGPQDHNHLSTQSSCNNGYSIHRMERIPSSFGGGEGKLRDHMCQFDILADYNNWSYREKGANLAMSLKDGAQQVLQELSPESRQDYNSIADTLKRRYDPDEKENLKRIEFRQRTKSKSETIAEFGFALKRLANGAYPDMPSDAKEILIIDQFIHGLSTQELRRHVQFQHPTTLQKAMSLANEFHFFESASCSQNREDSPLGIRSLKDRPEPSPTTDRLEREMETLKQELAKIKEFNSKAKFLPGVHCHHCKLEGHVEKSCPSKM